MLAVELFDLFVTRDTDGDVTATTPTPNDVRRVLEQRRAAGAKNGAHEG